MRNFYKHQDVATARSNRHLFWLTFAVMGTTIVTSIVIVYLALLACSGIKTELPDGQIVDLSEHLRSWPLAVEIMTGVSIFLVATCIAVKSYLKVRQLGSGGGAIIAQDLGATEIVEGDQLDANSRRLLNVVQEIAIAASIPPPPVYCMQNELSINAFAAGYTPRDAIICVTRGCLQSLNREQLQGVVAHEFSHILNGDMRQNIRTIGVLHGILFIIETAEICWQTATELWESQDMSGASVQLSIASFVAAVFLWPVGVVGLFFATIAKAGISQQREYLADATAVELTRNPHGVANALKRIAGFDKGTRVRSPMAIEASHLFFARGVGFNRLLSTHPPITDRIRRLDPLWDGVPEFEDDYTAEYTGTFEGTMNFATNGASGKNSNTTPTIGEEDSEDGERSLFAKPNDKERAYRSAVASTIPIDLLELLHEPLAAGATLLALRSSTKPIDCHEQFRQVADDLRAVIEALSVEQRLLLFDETLRAVAKQPLDSALIAELKRTVSRDPEDLFEFAWNNMVESWLKDLLREERPKPKFAKLEQAEAACSIAVSSLVHAGGNLGPAGEYAFRRGAAHMDLPSAQYRMPEECSIADLQAAADTLSLAAPGAKRLIGKTISACITADTEISANEALVVRGLVSKLGYPIPELLPGHPVTPGA
ncbi:MAG: M48 family metallopeptidase [Planctomycetales bacterium]|nr:M48 family metallopeptidase [Planctomycetales bacterium]